ncbi:predicted protein [Postia placenta Mad-698-R]|nr:predicted protein [Postia placenta Mad-698-R]
MSESSMNEAQLLRFYQYAWIESYIDIAATGLFVYDFIISFNQEWRAVWSRKIAGATAIYLALRYVTLANVITYVTNFTISSCEAAFASIRVYAIDGRRWMKAATVMMLGLVPVAINIYSGSKTFAYCNTEDLGVEVSISTSKYNILLLVTRICVLMSNLLVVISTWQATRASRLVTAWTSRGSLTAVLFRDGTIHFAIVVGLNAADVVVELLLGVGAIHMTTYNHSTAEPQKLIDLSQLMELISTVVLCHFFLNLRQFSSPDVNNSEMSSHASSFSSFASRIIGNLGEMLEDDPQALDDDFEGELDDLNDTGEVDGSVVFDDNTKAPSDADKAQTRMATAAIFEQETDKRGAADHGFLEAPDEGFDQRVIDVV